MSWLINLSSSIPKTKQSVKLKLSWILFLWHSSQGLLCCLIGIFYHNCVWITVGSSPVCNIMAIKAGFYTSQLFNLAVGEMMLLRSQLPEIVTITGPVNTHESAALWSNHISQLPPCFIAQSLPPYNLWMMQVLPSWLPLPLAWPGPCDFLHSTWPSLRTHLSGHWRQNQTLEFWVYHLTTPPITSLAETMGEVVLKERTREDIYCHIGDSLITLCLQFIGGV